MDEWDIRRDLDYRGQKVPFDFARAVFGVRQQQPGALEVLLDGIEEWFPNEFATSIWQAEEWAGRTNRSRVVLFNGRIARNRFRPWQDPRSTLGSPFQDRSETDVVHYGLTPYSVVVWPRALAGGQRKVGYSHWKDL